MIRRHNSAAFVPACLSNAANSRASRERVRAAQHYAQVPAPTVSYDFSVYRDDAVRDALAAVFANKCAYCEFRLDGAPFDIEHYRPKGKVREDDGTFSGGYWWLAADWSNLLPSCQDCNRSRYHETVDDGRHLFGKENLFPLIGGTPRSTGLGGEAAEIPGLLNPTVDEPRDHLVFTIEVLPDGKSSSSIVSARLRDDGSPDPRGAATWKVVGLNRPPLVRARAERLKSLRLALRSVEKTWLNYRQAEHAIDKDALLTEAREEMRETWEHFLSWDAPYSAACRAYYREWAQGLEAKAA